MLLAHARGQSRADLDNVMLEPLVEEAGEFLERVRSQSVVRSTANELQLAGEPEQLPMLRIGYRATGL